MSATEGVSVVIPTCNRPSLLRVTLAAVLAQRDVDFEVVVVDDHSEIPVEVRADDPHLRVIRQDERSGVAAARNLGIAAASKTWVAFTDDDDIWAPDKLASQLAELAGNPAAGWSSAGAVQVDDDLYAFENNRPPASGEVADLLLVSNPIPGGASGVIARTQLVRDIGGFDESLSMCADYDLWIRLALASPLVGIDRPLLAYRIHSGGMSRSLDHIGRELAIISAKYAGERDARGLAMADAINLWIGDRHQRSGRRLPAARAYLQSTSVVGFPRALARAAEAIVWPGAFRLRDARRARSIPPHWRVETERWLAPIRASRRDF